MAAQPRAKDPLDALQHLVNDVLIQTGKALRASRRDGHGNVAAPQGALQARLPETIKAFHAALDDLESDIIRAKSVLLRDLNEIQSQKAKANPSDSFQKQSIDQTPTSPNGMGLGMDLSPSAAHRDHHIKTEPMVKPVAPFPDMGMSLPDSNPAAAIVKEENAPTQGVSASGLKMESSTPSNSAGPMPTGDQKPSGGHMSGPGVQQDAMSMNSGLNFTDMEFTLAPTNNESQDQPVGDSSNMNEPSFDLASFVPADGNDNSNNSSNNMASLDGIIPSNLNAPMNAPANTEAQGKPVEQRNGDGQDSTFADIFTGDGQADGMDFDFSLGDGGMGGDTFDDLMNDRDSTFNTIEHGDFDATFFGLDKADGT